MRPCTGPRSRVSCGPGTTEPRCSPARAANKLPERPHQQGEGKRRDPGREGSPDAHPGAVPLPRPPGTGRREEPLAGGAVLGTASCRHLLLEETESGSAGWGRQVGVLPGLGVLGGAPAARARPAGAVPARPRAPRSLPCLAVCPLLRPRRARGLRRGLSGYKVKKPFSSYVSKNLKSFSELEILFFTFPLHSPVVTRKPYQPVARPENIHVIHPGAEVQKLKDSFSAV